MDECERDERATDGGALRGLAATQGDRDASPASYLQACNLNIRASRNLLRSILKRRGYKLVKALGNASLGQAVGPELIEAI